jgi:hypothetical protein
LNAIAGVLDGENADHWIDTASNHNRPEIKKLVQGHLAGSLAQKPGESTPTPVKSFKFHLHDERQAETVDAAIADAKIVKDPSRRLKRAGIHLRYLHEASMAEGRFGSGARRIGQRFRRVSQWAR